MGNSVTNASDPFGLEADATVGTGMTEQDYLLALAGDANPLSEIPELAAATNVFMPAEFSKPKADDWLDHTINFGYGFSDVATVGIAPAIRWTIGADAGIDYSAKSYWVGAATPILVVAIYQAPGLVAAEAVDTLAEEALTAATGQQVFLLLSPADLLQDGAKAILKKGAKEAAGAAKVAKEAAGAKADDFIQPGKKWYHGTDADSADDILKNGLDKDKLMTKMPVEGDETPGLFVTDLLKSAEDYADARAGERLSPPGTVLEMDDADIGPFLKGTKKPKDNEAVIPFDAFPQIPPHVIHPVKRKG